MESAVWQLGTNKGDNMKYDYIGLQTRWGDGNRSPSTDDLKKAIQELNTKDDEHPCAFVSNEFGDVVEAYQDGKVLYYNLDLPNDRKEIKVDKLNKILDIWILFCEEKKGELEKLFK